jgi:hypothetical protein
MSEWISVEDRLPPFFEDVLVCLIDESGHFIGISFLFDNMGKLPYWAYCGIGGDPQYWMPLPAPPEGKND